MLVLVVVIVVVSIKIIRPIWDFMGKPIGKKVISSSVLWWW